VALSEFSIIDRYFTPKNHKHSQVQLGVGDDCAILSMTENSEWVVTVDTMVEGVHFFPNTQPEFLAHKLVAVNLSDLSSMGARPVALTLALTLPTIDEDWLQRFSERLFKLTDRFEVDLIGGDTTSGPLTLTLQALGLVPKGQALTRHRAKVGDFIYMTGFLGDAGLGLKVSQGFCVKDSAPVLDRFHCPEPRVAVGLMILPYANACVDISDGLLSDLGHVLQRSGVGANLFWEQMPLSPQVRRYIDETQDWKMPLSSGDDYELCFTVSPENQQNLERCLSEQAVRYTRIGVIEAGEGLFLTKAGVKESIVATGFKHFR
jgi:thiamine-monophosphate kinase